MEFVADDTSLKQSCCIITTSVFKLWLMNFNQQLLDFMICFFLHQLLKHLHTNEEENQKQLPNESCRVSASEVQRTELIVCAVVRGALTLNLNTGHVLSVVCELAPLKI